jgi:hypothetical protein
MQKPRINATPLGQYKATFIPSAWLMPTDKPLPEESQLLDDTDLDAELLLVLTTSEVQVGL